MCYHPDPVIINNQRGITLFLDDCSSYEIETTGVNISNYAIKGLLKAMIRKMLSKHTKYDKNDKPYWDVEGKI